jgi:hypothetical protein
VEAKYFGVDTSVQMWIGIEIWLSKVPYGKSFWIGWGRRNIGYGLKLEEQSEADKGLTIHFP